MILHYFYILFDLETPSIAFICFLAVCKYEATAKQAEHAKLVSVSAKMSHYSFKGKKVVSGILCCLESTVLNIYFPQLKGKLFFIHSIFSYDTVHREH